jgi:hypothetical protein
MPEASAGASESTGPAQSAVPGQVGTGGPPDPANFVATIDNAWFPLAVGSRWTYRGTREEEAAVDTVTVTSQRKVIQGVSCVVVHDVLTMSGVKAEETDDWYAQDRQGNVWYFGEDTKELDESGKVTSREGSWESGKDGAVAGLFMPANPQVGYSGQQEFYAGHAEDRFVVLLTTARLKVRYGSFRNVMVTAEWTRLEPDVLGEKFYAKGIGELKELDVTGGNESLELVSFRKP